MINMVPQSDVKNLEIISKKVRRDVVEMCHNANSSHIGSALSIVDILVALYFKIMNISTDNLNDRNRDIFILSKGHAAPALYSVLNHKGIIKNVDLKTDYCSDGKCFAQHISSKLPGIEHSTGSLGHGLSVAAGIAIANKMDEIDSNIYVILGDGECNEGAVWEAAQLISAERLNKITVIIDLNHHQALESGSRILTKEKNIGLWKALDFELKEVDGHSFEELISNLESNKRDKPKLIMANTIKGKGVSYMENKFEWHYKSPDEAQLKQALSELK
ncbi:MAG: transketolase [Nanoarchaeota archaeon]|nr:transketolase [Nanoarchaeota archaeon]